MSSAPFSYGRFVDDSDTHEDEFQPGDLMLKHATLAATSIVIATGQKLTHPLKGAATIVHAAMYIGDNKVVEADASGMVTNKLSDNLSHYKYDVYRYKGEDAEVLIEAVLARAGLTLKKKTSYTIFGAFKSLFKSSSSATSSSSSPASTSVDKVPLLSSSECFCSGAVVDWYNWAAVDKDLSNPFNAKGKAISPQELKGILDALPDWKFIGTIPRG
jgi:hypothetical protein